MEDLLRRGLVSAGSGGHDCLRLCLCGRWGVPGLAGECGVNGMKVYKGTDKDIKCRGYQFTPGVEAVEERAELCEAGFHACEAPLDVLAYYPPSEGSRYFEAELEDVSDERHGTDSKVCGKRITIGAELGIPGLVKAHMEYVKNIIEKDDNAKKSSGDDASIGSSGDDASIGSSGDAARIGSSGDDASIGSSGDAARIGSSGDDARIGSSGRYARIGSSGDDARIGSSGRYARIGSSGYAASIGSSGDDASIGSSGDDASIGSSGRYARIGSSGDDAKVECKADNAVVSCVGANAKIKAPGGTWITLAEYGEWDGTGYPCVCVKSAQIDGETLKPDTWYMLKGGEFVEVTDDD